MKVPADGSLSTNSGTAFSPGVLPGCTTISSVWCLVLRVVAPLVLHTGVVVVF